MDEKCDNIEMASDWQVFGDSDGVIYIFQVLKATQKEVARTWYSLWATSDKS